MVIVTSAWWAREPLWRLQALCPAACLVFAVTGSLGADPAIAKDPIAGQPTVAVAEPQSPARGASSEQRAGSSLTATPTFTRDVAPILYARCVGCHAPGGAAPFTLTSYADAKRHARQIVDATTSRYMPPWKPDHGYGAFARARRLTDHQLDTLRRWVEQGTHEGDPGHLPSRPATRDGWQLGTPDAVATMPEAFTLPSDGGDVFRTFVLPIPVEGDRIVEGIEFRVASLAAVHHANIKVDATRASQRLDDEEPGPGFDGGASREAAFPDGHFLGWTPGQTPQMLDGIAWRLPRGSHLVIELHLVPTGRPEPIQVSVGLHFTDLAPTLPPYMLRIGSQRIDIPPGDREYVATDSYVLPVDVELLRVQPHAHLLATRIEGEARLPDGSVVPLIRISSWDVRWQDVYEYETPVKLPAGTTLTMRVRYDNSATNPRNPHRPPRRVTFGQSTRSEMGDLWLQVRAGSHAARAALDRDYAPKMLLEDIAGVEKGVELAPTDSRLRVDLGLCYLEAGRRADALRELRLAVQHDPRSAAARYELGTLLLNDGARDDARRELSMAISLRPTLAEAHNNLGVAHYLDGGRDDAERGFREAIRLRPDHGEAHFNLGRLLQADGRRDSAVVHYRRALSLAQEDAEVHTALASLLASSGDVVEAVAHYRAALESKADLPAALVDLAWLLATTERADVRAPQEAVRLAERAAELTRREDAMVLDTLAAALFAAGDRSRAIATARQALERATRQGLSELAERIAGRLKFYEAEP